MSQNNFSKKANDLRYEMEKYILDFLRNNDYTNTKPFECYVILDLGCFGLSTLNMPNVTKLWYEDNPEDFEKSTIYYCLDNNDHYYEDDYGNLILSGSPLFELSIDDLVNIVNDLEYESKSN